jgi:hypothetical protein
MKNHEGTKDTKVREREMALNGVWFAFLHALLPSLTFVPFVPSW